MRMWWLEYLVRRMDNVGVFNSVFFAFDLGEWGALRCLGFRSEDVSSTPKVL